MITACYAHDYGYGYGYEMECQVVTSLFVYIAPVLR